MSKKIWFGNENHFQWAPAPQAGAEAQNTFYSEGAQKQNGGRARKSSARYSKVYNFSMVGETKDMEGVNVYNKFASGFFRSRRVHFADPYAYETNLFSAGWAAPGMIEEGWKNIYTTTPTFSNALVNIYDQPLRKATWAVTTAANATPVTDPTIPYFIIPIPPTHTLYVGASGAATGTAVVKVEGWPNRGAAAGSATNLTLLSEAGATRMNATVSGALYAYAKVYITRTSTAASTLTLTSLMAQLYKSTGPAPVLFGSFLPGEGHKQLAFADDALAEDYRFMFPPQKGIAVTLEEID